MTNHGTQYRTVTTGGSYLSSSDKRVHFGMGTDASEKEIEIDWPSGIVQKLANAKADEMRRIDEPAQPATIKKIRGSSDLCLPGILYLAA